MIGQAVREIAAVQRRMDNLSHYLGTRSGCRPDPPEPDRGHPKNAARVSTALAQAAPGVGGLGML